MTYNELDSVLCGCEVGNSNLSLNSIVERVGNGECVTLNDKFVEMTTVEGVLELNDEFIPINHME